MTLVNPRSKPEFFPSEVGFSSSVQSPMSPSTYEASRTILSPEITTDTIRSIQRVVDLGVNASMVEIQPSYKLDNDIQSMVMTAVVDLERRFPEKGISQILFDRIIHPVGAAWFDLSKRAIALEVLYKPDLFTLGGDIDASVYTEEIFDGRSAFDYLKLKQGPEKAKNILERYNHLILTEVRDESDKEDEYGLKSAPYLAGVPDAIAVRNRRDNSMGEMIDISKQLVKETGRPLKYASLGCGIASPMFDMVQRLMVEGVKVANVSLVDGDPMALATAKSLAEKKDLGDKITILKRNLLSGDMSEYLSDVDIAEALGLFEYFPSALQIKNSPIRYRMAQNFLNEVGRAMKPGSYFVFGNMVDSRPHQTMFNQVWPKLEQRSIPDMVEMIVRAGYPEENISVRISDDGIYAVYALKIPEKGVLPKLTMDQVVLKKLLPYIVKDY